MDNDGNLKRPYIIGAPSHREAKSARSNSEESMWEDELYEDEHSSQEYAIRASEDLHKALADAGGVLQPDLESKSKSGESKSKSGESKSKSGESSNRSGQAASSYGDHLLESLHISPGDAGPLPTTPRSRVRAEYFKRKKHPNLIRTNHGLKKSLEDVTGIREWWTENKKEWRKKKAELARIIDAINILETHELYDENFNEEELQEYKRRQLESVKWFHDNKTLMRIVWKRFWMINEGMIDDLKPRWTDIVNNSPRVNPIFYETSPSVIQFQYCSPRDLKLTLRWLVDLPDAFWWLQIALKDLRGHQKRLEELIDKLANDKENCTALIKTLEVQVKFEVDLVEDDIKADLQILKLMEEGPGDYKVLIQTVVEDRRLRRFACHREWA